MPKRVTGKLEPKTAIVMSLVTVPFLLLQVDMFAVKKVLMFENSVQEWSTVRATQRIAVQHYFNVSLSTF